jgi:KEOPS complex subunit Pcc1
VSLLWSPYSLQRARGSNKRVESPLNVLSGKKSQKNKNIFNTLFVHIPVQGNPMLLHEAVFRFSTSHSQQIYRALAPELSDDVNPRSTTRCWLEGENTLVLKVEAQDIAALRAALNMVLRLVNVADEMQEIG